VKAVVEVLPDLKTRRRRFNVSAGMALPLDPEGLLLLLDTFFEPPFS